MLVTVMLALVLPCSVVSAAFAIYLFLMWRSGSANEAELRRGEKALPEQGLSEAELEKLPKLTGKDLVMEPECAICLEQIESDQPARLLPGCNHGFHVQCADTWLSRNSVCPVCRIRINPHPSDSENPCRNL